MARNGRPSKAELAAIARKLRPGEQRAVGGGVYMRVDGSGRMRFQFRLRSAGYQSINGGRTFGSWDEAAQARTLALAAKFERRSPLRKGALRKLTLDRYAEQEWWPDVVQDTEPLTQLDYRQVLARDVLPYWKGWTLEQIEEADDELVRYRAWLRERKTISKGPRAGKVAEAACEKAIATFIRVLNHALAKRVIGHNPAAADRRERRKRSRARAAMTTRRPIRRREVRQPSDIEQIRFAMRGRGPWLRLGRLMVSLAGWEGVRPGEIMALRHEHWRDHSGPRAFLSVDGALKDIAGHLQPGPTKTHRDREVILWPAVAEELEALYQAQGCPPLSALVIPNRDGEFARWDNWRDRNWYAALHAAGFSDAPIPSANGAFDPYSLRHTCATLMLHATRPGTRAPYTILEVARQLGHDAKTLIDYYAAIMEDVHGFAGESMDDIIRIARREAWGVLPGDAGFTEVELTIPEASAVTGLSVKALHGRAASGSLATRRNGSRYLVAAHELLWSGLISRAQHEKLIERKLDGRDLVPPPRRRRSSRRALLTRADLNASE